jgi:hypothetical protein
VMVCCMICVWIPSYISPYSLGFPNLCCITLIPPLLACSHLHTLPNPPRKYHRLTASQNARTSRPYKYPLVAPSLSFYQSPLFPSF